MFSFKPQYFSVDISTISHNVLMPLLAILSGSYVHFMPTYIFSVTYP